MGTKNRIFVGTGLQNAVLEYVFVKYTLQNRIKIVDSVLRKNRSANSRKVFTMPKLSLSLRMPGVSGCGWSV